MSTVSKKKRLRPNDAAAKPAEATAAVEESAPPAERPRRKRRLVIGGSVLVALTLLVALLPTIVVHTPLLGVILRRAAKLNGTLTFQSASLGWFRPTAISGIKICDAQGETVFEADRVACNRTLPRLIFSSANLGTLRIEKPRLNARISPQGSNVQEVLARWLSAPSSASGGVVDLTLEVADGEATIRAPETQEVWQLTNLQLELDLARQSSLPTRLEGTVAYRGDLALLRPWIDTAAGNAKVRLGGRVAGTAAVRQTDGGIDCRTESDIEQLTVDAPSPQPFRDPHAHCVVQCSYRTAESLFQLGPMSFRFSGGDYCGFQVGPGELKLRLVNGTLQSEPIEVTCNRGTLSAQAELRTAAEPMEFRLSAGTLANRVQLDPAACHSALKYVVPVIASATQSQGQFSIRLDGCRIPLSDLSRAEIGGRVIVHSATMDAGPLVRQLTPVLTSPPSLVRIPAETVVLFRMTGGRIYHQGLVLEFPELTVRTFGSVGLDNSLKLMVETSVPLAWLPKSGATDALRKQKMQIPLGGTLESPRLDVAELARVKNQVLGNLARGVLESGLGQQLNRLIQGGR